MFSDAEDVGASQPRVEVVTDSPAAGLSPCSCQTAVAISSATRSRKATSSTGMVGGTADADIA